ncbi:MAG: hypothetical protein LBD50_03840 [Rickettsiales bacterium]|jgi:hypothetical protein|nr:hypothetical protein [Rickettsiales bacterium]
MKITRKYLFVFSLLAIFGCQQYAQRGQQQYDTVNVVENYVIDENSVPIFPKKAALTTDTARRFSIELPKRCKVDWNNQNILSIVPEEKVEIVRLDTGDPLPSFDVSDYEFTKLTVKETLDKLLDGTDISVVEDEDLPEKITGSIQSGSLADSVDLIAKLGRAYYSYDDDAKEIHLLHRAKWLMKMPKNENIIMALLDAMHGSDMRNLLVDWQDKTVVFEGNYQTEREVSKIVADVGSKKYMIAWDIDVYRVYPRTDNPIVWMNMLPAFGDKNIKMSIPGVVGRGLVVSPEINTKTLQEFLSQQGNVVLISQGTFVIPNGWQSRFDIGQCGKEERLETDLTIGATAKYGDYAGMKKIDAKIVLRTRAGELSSFKIPSSLGDNYVIIGIPTHSFVTDAETLISPFAELVAFMSPRVISIMDAEKPESEIMPLSGQALRDYLEE